MVELNKQLLFVSWKIVLTVMHELRVQLIVSNGYFSHGLEMFAYIQTSL